MNILTIKQSDFADGTPKGSSDGAATAPAGDHSLTFADLLKTAGIRIEKGYNVLTDREGVTTLPDDAERAAPTDTDDQVARQRSSDGTRNADDRPGDDDFGERDSDNDDDSQPEVKTATSNDDGDHQTRGADSSHDNEYGRDTGTAGGQPAGETSATSAGTATDESVAASDGTAPADGQTPPPVADGEGIPADTDPQKASQVLAGLLAAAQAPNVPGQGDPAGDRGQAADGRGNAVQGLSNAFAAVTKSTPADGNGTGQSQTNGNPNPQAQTHGQAQGTAQAAGQGQATPTADATASATSGAAQQAAALSKAVGDGTPIEVRVNVTDRAATVVSQPGPSLSSSAVLATDGATQTQGTRQPTHAPATPAANPAAGQASGQSGQTQAQVQAAIAQTAQAGPTSVGSADGPGPAVAAASQVQAAGAEAVPSGATPASPDTAPSHNTTPAQAAAHRPGVTSQSVADQVSVQITKAIKDGLDKINIQLKPSSLGRIDVRLEVGHDGRVQALVMADNKDTLDLLQRDARGLERALQDAGLQADAGDLSFSLRGQSGQGTDDEPAPAHGPIVDATELDPAMDDADLLAALSADGQGGIFADGRIDIRA